MSNSEKHYDGWMKFGLIVVPLSFLLMILLLWNLNFFDFTGDEASAKIVGTALTLGGGLVATMVTLIGLILRQSMEKRNADLRDEAEKRLKLEAAIRAVDLLGTDAGGNSTETQRIGALFTLSHLGMIDLAVDLVQLMRPAQLISAEATVNILDMALRSGNPLIQGRACAFIRDHSDKFYDVDGFSWPDFLIYSWPKELSYDDRLCLFEGLMNALLALPKKDWDVGSLNFIVYCLANAYYEEEDKHLKIDIANFLSVLLQIYDIGEVINFGQRDLKIDEIRDQVKLENKGEITDYTIQGIRELEKWIKEV